MVMFAFCCLLFELFKKMFENSIFTGTLELIRMKDFLEQIHENHTLLLLQDFVVSALRSSSTAIAMD